jgi:hypothetical protein
MCLVIEARCGLMILWPQRVTRLIKQLPSCCNIGVDYAECKAKIVPVLKKLDHVRDRLSFKCSL